LACDPRPAGAGGSGGAAPATATGAVVVVAGGGTIDLDGGTPFPPGRLKCFDPETGTGFDCSQSGLVCCVKKDVCYDPPREPTFCDRPYCD
jgi:hypothetical protein